MTLKKRGLGRGLEALLVDVPVTDTPVKPIQLNIEPITQTANMPPIPPLMPIATQQIDDEIVIALTLIKNLHQERANLLAEAEQLKQLINEFERIVNTELL